MDIDSFALGKTNRSSNESVYIGGKSINVSIMLNNLGVDSTLIGFMAGFTGNYIQQELKNYPHIHTDFIEVNGMTRINVKLRGIDETEINGVGTQISKENIIQLEDKMASITVDDLVVLTGSVAHGMDYDWYVQISKQLHDRNIPFIVDIASDVMLNIIQYEPLLIKPNESELKKIFNKTNMSEEEMMIDGKHLIDMGAKHCIVSLGDEGSFLFEQNEILRASVPHGQLVSSVGAGDSMVAGFIASWIKEKDYKLAYKLAVTCGSATAYSKHLADKQLVDRLYEQVIIRNIKED